MAMNLVSIVLTVGGNSACWETSSGTWRVKIKRRKAALRVVKVISDRQEYRVTSDMLAVAVMETLERCVGHVGRFAQEGTVGLYSATAVERASANG